MSQPLISAVDLAEFRAMAEAEMLDTCRVTRIRKDANGEPVETTVAGVVTQTTDVVYDGDAKRQTNQSYEQKPRAGDHTFTVQRYLAHFPIGSFRPQIGDLVEWTACPANPDREGTVDRIAALFDKTSATAMRVFVDQEVA